ncbi:hypothetical protein U91I_02117 [alpha proteobacterium U9-1i]|nr:hypothetical protein U91I_02117 [alpha proteobacterium U9-1i]
MHDFPSRTRAGLDVNGSAHRASARIAAEMRRMRGGFRYRRADV